MIKYFANDVSIEGLKGGQGWIREGWGMQSKGDVVVEKDKRERVGMKLKERSINIKICASIDDESLRVYCSSNDTFFFFS